VRRIVRTPDSVRRRQAQVRREGVRHEERDGACENEGEHPKHAEQEQRSSDGCHAAAFERGAAPLVEFSC
jgi:hypothetical protein